ncbi:hypothetical protein [Luteolibacter sp. Populi]|uniref:hypothetical protein n=1 Tax=Luteolibacter sp. Populi TaxID=3230487 RepID=UPI0034652C3B
MRSRGATTALVLLVIAAGGAIRMRFEHDLTADFRRRGLLAKPLDLDMRERIGQDKWSVALAGLRTLVASFAGLKTTEQFNNTDWPGLAESVDTTVQLSPHTQYYWDIGGWHLAYNAASSYRYDKGLSKLRGEAEGRRWIERGREFYERGIRNNPDDWQLSVRLGNLYSDSFRYPDDAKAVTAYSRAYATGRAIPQVRRLLLQARARSGEDAGTLLKELRSIFAEDPNSRVPTLLSLQYVLEAKLSPPTDYVESAVKIFGSEKRALRLLGTYFTNVGDRLPQTAVEPAVRLLERKAGIAPEDPQSYIRQREELESIARIRRYGR